MRVVPASWQIQDDLDQRSLAVRIESCGRVCYKSEDQINEDSAVPFIKKILKHGHNSVAEMAVVSLKVQVDSESLAGQLFGCLPRFLRIDRIERGKFIITASVRAYRELYREHASVKLVKAIGGFLLERYPLFFEDLPFKRAIYPLSGVEVTRLGLAEVEKLPADLLVNHRYLGVRFVTNRAVTHEIVRHRPCSFLQESQRYCRYSDDKFDNQVTFIKPMFFEEGSPEYALWLKAMEETEKIYLSLLATSSPQAARTVLPNSCKTEIIVYANLMEWLHIFKLRTTRAAEPSMREVMEPLLGEFIRRYPTIFEAVTGGEERDC